MPCDYCEATIIPPAEVIAAHSIKLLARMVKSIENDSRKDKFEMLKEKVDEMNPLSDAILGTHILTTLDNCGYLLHGTREK